MKRICANCRKSDFIGTGMNDPLQCKVTGRIVGDFDCDCNGEYYEPTESTPTKEDETNE